MTLQWLICLLRPPTHLDPLKILPKYYFKSLTSDKLNQNLLVCGLSGSIFSNSNKCYNVQSWLWSAIHKGVTMVSGIGMQPWAVHTRLCTGKPPQRFLKYRFLRPHEIRISGVGIQIYSPLVGVYVGHCFQSFLIQLIILEVSTKYLAQITPPCELSPVKSFTVPLWATECSFCYFFSIFIFYFSFAMDFIIQSTLEWISQSSCPSIPNTRITSMCHHSQVIGLFYKPGVSSQKASGRNQNSQIWIIGEFYSSLTSCTQINS